MRKSLLIVWLIIAMLINAAIAEEQNDGSCDMPELKVHFLNIGRNDAILITINDESAFIDGGSHRNGLLSAEYMKSQGVEHLKYYIGTHAHIDHIGGAGAVLAQTPADQVLINSKLAESVMLDCSHSVEERDAICGTPQTIVKMGDVFDLGGAVLRCVGPQKTILIPDSTEGAENENSLIFRLEYGNISFLLTGDATNDVLLSLSGETEDFLHATVVKNPHHGHRIKDEAISRLECDYYVYSTSDDSLPNQNMVDVLREMGIQVLITSDSYSGTVVFSTDGTSVEYECQKRMKNNWKLDFESVTMRVGEKKRIVHIIPVDTLRYESSDNRIAYANGGTSQMIAVSPGSCIIRATAFDGSYREVQVNVIE